jgi:hypothetical protein
MPFMRVWFTWNQRVSAVCAWESCQLLLDAPSKCVQGVLTYEGTPSRRFRWHPECYIAQGLEYLEENPPVDQERGHRSNKNFSPAQQLERHALAAKKSRLKKLKESAIEQGFWWRMRSIDEEIRVIERVMDTMESEPIS